MDAEAPRQRARPGAPLRASDPRRAGPYTLLRRLGEGGTGTVFLARRAGDAPVAIKMLRADLAATETSRRLVLREADAARRVARFCTAEVLDVDVEAGRPFLVTEYVPGPTLDRVIRTRGPMAAPDLERLAVSVAAALTAIHGAGLVHRDLKPSNVLLSPLGPRVIDFGIARLVAAGNLVSGAGRAGTPQFMAPEQAAGGEVGAPADVFAWGAVVAFAAAGRPPFGDGPREALLGRIVTRPPDLTGLDSGLRPLVERAMSKNPAGRPTAHELFLALLGTHPVSFSDADARRAAAAGPAPRALTAVPRRLVAAGIIGALALAGGVAYAMTRPDRPPVDITAVSRRVADDAGTPDPALRRQLSLAAYRIDPTGAAAARLLATFGPARLATLTGHTGVVWASSFGPSDRILATASSDRTVRLWGVTDPSHPVMLASVGQPDAAYAPAISPDGRVLAVGGAGRAVRLWTIGDPRRPVPGATMPIVAGGTFALAFSPGGRLLAAAGSDGTITLWSVADPSRPVVVAVLAGHTSAVRTIAFSMDGRLLTSGGADGTTRLWDVAGRAQVATIRSGAVYAVTISGDGRTLATAGPDGTTRLWSIRDPGAPVPVATLPRQTGAVTGAAFSPDGALLATSGDDRAVRLWDVHDAVRPTLLATIGGLPGWVDSVTFGLDGGTFAVTGQPSEAGLWTSDPRVIADRACTDPSNRISKQTWDRYLPELPYRPTCP